MLTSNAFHSLVGNICLCVCVLRVTGHFFAKTENRRLPCKQRMVLTSAELVSKQNHEIGPLSSLAIRRNLQILQTIKFSV